MKCAALNRGGDFPVYADETEAEALVQAVTDQIVALARETICGTV